MNLLRKAVVDQLIEEYEAHIMAMRPQRGTAPPQEAHEKLGTSGPERYINFFCGGRRVSITSNYSCGAVEAPRPTDELSGQACQHCQL